MSYFERMHIARMAGCFNESMDHIDEFELPPELLHELVTTLLPDLIFPIKDLKIRTKSDYYTEKISHEVDKFGLQLNAFGKKQKLFDIEKTISILFKLNQPKNKCINPCL